MSAIGDLGLKGLCTRDFLYRAVLTFAVNFVFLLISNQMPDVGEGTDIRIAAFVPIVFGIVWGFPAAIGVMLANMLSDAICSYDPFSIVFGGIANGMAAMLAYRLFYMFGKSDNMYIHDARSLIQFFFTVLVVEAVLGICVSILLVRYIGIDIFEAFQQVFLINVEFALILGLPAMLLVPSIRHKTCGPKVSLTDRWRYMLALILLVPLVMFCIIWSGCTVSTELCLMLSFICIAVFLVFAPRVSVGYRDSEFHSLKFRGFRQIMVVSMFVVLVLVILENATIFLLIGRDAFSIRLIYFNAAFILSIVTVSFSLVQSIVERNITKPMYNMTSRLMNDDDVGKNEVAVLKDRLDFASEVTEDIGGNEYRLYIGLTTKDGKDELDPAEVMPIIDSICLRYVGGYHSVKGMVGGYRGNEADCKENVLVYTIYGATDDQISGLVTDLVRALDQESIMIEKNRVARWYHGDGTSEEAESLRLVD